MGHFRLALAAGVLILGAFGLVACGSSGEDQITSPWPEATSERTVAEPAKAPRWPLTGLPAESAGAISRRIVSVKIENSATARPQSGLQGADVVYETVVEGGITRFNALYQSTLPDPVGPVRSARLSDRYIVPQYHAIFTYSGASDSVDRALAGVEFDNLSQDVGVAEPSYYRFSERAAPHNLYLHLDRLYEEAAQRDIATTGSVQGFAFDTTLASGEDTPAVTQIDVPFSNANEVIWKYDAGSGTYLRWHNGDAHTDALTDEQISAKNVIVVWARYTLQSAVDVSGSNTYDITLVGSGRMTLFKNGQQYDGTWEMTEDAPPVFTDAEGSAIELAPGNTWFQVIDTGVNITLK